jgi:amino acid adenylation domain-containing protein
MLAVCVKNNLTPFSFLLAAYYVLFLKYTDESDVSINVPYAGRGAKEVHGNIGCFLNVLRIRINTATYRTTYADLLTIVCDTWLEAYQHADVPYQSVVNTTESVTSDHSGAFQVMFTMMDNFTFDDQNDRTAELRWLEDVNIPTLTAKLDLDLTMQRQPDGGYEAWFEYRTNMFERSTIERMGRHFCTIIATAVEQPDCCIGDMSLLDQDELELVTLGWNRTEERFAAVHGIHELLINQVTLTPDAVAISDSTTTWSYAELDTAADQIASCLLDQGVGTDTLVVVCMERTVQMVAAIHGILRAGGAYVPIEASFPHARVEFLLEDSGPRAILTDECSQKKHPVLLADGIVVSPGGLGRMGISNLALAAPAESSRRNLAYVIYTSGTTGRPKGVLVEHGGLVNNIQHVCKNMIKPEQLRATLFSTSICFDQSITELFAVHAVGGRLHLVDTLLDPGWDSAGVRCIVATPSVLGVLMTTRALPVSVAAVVLGGEAVPQQMVDALYAGGVADVYNSFGPTECTDQCTTNRMASQTPRASIGRPIANVQVYVLDDDLKPVAVGLPGTMYVAGAGVSRGYLNRPELTKEKFATNLFGPGRMYNTGDLVRWTNLGDLQYLGRRDTQIKLRGHRIELGEVQAIVAQHSQVMQAACDVRGEGQSRFLACYVVTAVDGNTATPEFSAALRVDLRRWCSRRLPAASVPATFTVIEALPLSNSGKVVGSALPEPSAEDRSVRSEGRSGTGRAFVPPCSSTEERVSKIWCSVLGIDAVGLHDDFFELGGSSLTALACTSKAYDVFGTPFMFSDMIRCSTLCAFASLADSKRAATAGVAPVQRNADRELCSPMQGFLLYFESPQDDAWINTAEYWLSGSLSLPALEAAVNFVVARQVALRTVFDDTPAETQNRKFSPGSLVECVQWVLPTTDTRYYSSTDVTSARLARDSALALFRGGAMTNLDVRKGPCFRCRTMRVSATDILIAFESHHAVMDGASWGILLSELSTCYAAFADGVEPMLPPLPVSYLDWSAGRSAVYMSAEVARALSDTVEELRGGENRGTSLRTDSRRDLSPGWFSELRPHGRHTCVIAPPVEAALRRVAANNGCTYFAVVMAVLHVWQRWLTGKQDVSLMVTGNTRDGATADVIGSFISDVVLRTDLTAASTFEDVVGRTKAVCSRALGRLDTAPLAAWDAIFEDQEPLPYFILVDWIPAAGRGFVLAGEVKVEELGPAAPKPGIAESELELEIDEETGEVSWEYDSTLYRAATIEAMADDFVRLAALVAASPVALLPTAPDPFDGWLGSTLPPAAECAGKIERWQQRIAEARSRLGNAVVQP